MNNGLSARTAVLVDATSINRRMKGVGRYAWHLCVALDRGLPPDTDLVMVVFDGDLPDFPAGFRAKFVRLKYCSEFELGLREFPRLIHETRARVFIRPADKIGRKYSVSSLTVCHDINPMIWNVQSPRSWTRKIVDSSWELFRGNALRHSAQVICNSKFVRQAAIKRFRLNPEKVTVGYCGVDGRIPLLAVENAKAQLSDKIHSSGFLFAFATGDEREGYRILPELWAAAQAAGYRGRLVVAGVNENALYARELRSSFEARGANGSVTFLPFLGEEKIAELASLYGRADFYLETSRHEGFGMQLLEAMACGTTCFSSGRGALEEISGGFALFLDINDAKAAGKAVAEAWHAGMHERDNSQQAAFARAYNWDDTCNQVVEFARTRLQGKTT